MRAGSDVCLGNCEPEGTKRCGDFFGFQWSSDDYDLGPIVGTSTETSSLNMSSSPGSATVFSSQLASGHSKSEIGFCRKGLSGLAEI
jgi:hypothetical protein